MSAAQPTMRPGGYHSSLALGSLPTAGTGRDRRARWVRNAVGAAIERAKIAAKAGPSPKPKTIVPASAEVSPATVPQPRPARQSGSGARYKSTPARAVGVEAEATSAAATRPDPAPMMSGVGIFALSRLQAVRGGKSPAPTSIQASSLALASY